MELDIVLYDGKTPITERSSKHPDHYFNKGYLRSPYNDAGFNLFVQSVIGKDFYSIFDPIVLEVPSEEEKASWSEEEWFYHVHPLYSKEHLENALQHVKEVIEELKVLPNYAVKTVEAEENGPFLTTQEALKWTMEQKENENPYNYETPLPNNASGRAWFGFVDPMNVVAIIPARKERYINEEFASLFKLSNLDLSSRVVYIVYEVEGLMDYYIQQAEICQEFIEKALTLNEPRIGGF